MSEISHYFSLQRLREEGESGYQYYLDIAETSLVPPFFVDVANAYLFKLPEFSDLPITEKARLLFNAEFDSDREAWFAINYAQAIALVKKEADVKNREIDSNQMLAGVGVAVLLEDSLDEALEAIKERVEDVFADPREALRIARMYEDLRLGAVQN